MCTYHYHSKYDITWDHISIHICHFNGYNQFQIDMNERQNQYLLNYYHLKMNNYMSLKKIHQNQIHYLMNHYLTRTTDHCFFIIELDSCF